MQKKRLTGVLIVPPQIVLSAELPTRGDCEVKIQMSNHPRKKQTTRLSLKDCKGKVEQESFQRIEPTSTSKCINQCFGKSFDCSGWCPILTGTKVVNG